MKHSEAALLLAKMTAYDRRTVGQPDVEAWADAMTRASIDLADAVECVAQHFQETNDWLMPNHIIERVRLIRRRRVAECKIVPEVPADLHQAQERAWLLSFWDAVKRAEADPQAVADAGMGIRRPELPAADQTRVAAIERLGQAKSVPQIRPGRL